MAEVISWITGIAGVSLATIGTLDVTVGFVTAATLLVGLAFGSLRKAKGRA